MKSLIALMIVAGFARGQLVDAGARALQTGTTLNGVTLQNGGGGPNLLASSYGCVADEQIVTDGAISSSAKALTSASALFAAGDVGKAVKVNGAGAAGVDLVTTITAFVSSSHVTTNAAAGTTVTNAVVSWGTDNSTCLGSLNSALNVSGGTGWFGNGMYAVSGQISWPNNAASFALQASMRWTGVGGYGVSNDAPGSHIGHATLKGGTILDLWYGGGSATSAKLDTLGAGKLELDHLTLTDSGTDTTPFIHTTNTTLLVHDNSIICDTYGQDGFVFGGTTITINTNVSTNAFQGYGTSIHDNFMDGCNRMAYFRAYANAIQFYANSCFTTCAGTAPIVMDGGTVATSDGNFVYGNYLELGSYTYAYQLTNAVNNTFGDNLWDTTGGFSAYARVNSGAYWNYFNEGGQLSDSVARFSGAGAANNTWCDGYGCRASGSPPAVGCDLTVQIGVTYTDTSGTSTVPRFCAAVNGGTPGWVPYTFTLLTPVALTAQTTSIGSTSMGTPGAGYYRACAYVLVTTAGSAGTVTVTLGWTDANGSETSTPISTFSIASQGYSQGCTFLKVASGNVTYATTVTSAVGSPQYSLDVNVEKVK